MEKRKHVLFSNEEKELIQQCIDNENVLSCQFHNIGEYDDEEFSYRSKLINSIETKLKLLGVLDYE